MVMKMKWSGGVRMAQPIMRECYNFVDVPLFYIQHKVPRGGSRIDLRLLVVPSVTLEGVKGFGGNNSNSFLVSTGYWSANVLRFGLVAPLTENTHLPSLQSRIPSYCQKFFPITVLQCPYSL